MLLYHHQQAAVLPASALIIIMGLLSGYCFRYACRHCSCVHAHASTSKVCQHTAVYYTMVYVYHSLLAVSMSTGSNRLSNNCWQWMRHWYTWCTIPLYAWHPAANKFMFMLHAYAICMHVCICMCVSAQFDWARLCCYWHAHIWWCMVSGKYYFNLLNLHMSRQCIQSIKIHYIYYTSIVRSRLLRCQICSHSVTTAMQCYNSIVTSMYHKHIYAI
jgi:hypothetical protein